MTLRAAELEVLYTVNTDQVQKAEKDVRASGERLEKKPISTKIESDEASAIAGMDRVEGEAKRLVSADTVVKLDAEIDRAEKGIDRTKARLEDLQVKADAGLDVKADTARAEAQLQKMERSLAGLKDARTRIELDADASAALAALGQVESGTKRLVSADVVAKVDADITSATRNVTRIQAELEVLNAQEPSPRVLVDISRAESRLDTAQKKLASLEGARATMEIDADTSSAEASFNEAEAAAGASGAESGAAFSSSVITALASIPIAGAIIGVGAAAGKLLVDEFQDALKIEVRQDRLQALTGIDESDAQRLGRAAGEAYAGTFGESIEANMDTARLALQFDLIDADSSTRSSQRVIEGLSGISDVLDEDVRPIAAAVTTMLSTGLVKSADEAFDLIAVGAREGVNRNEDLIDTLTEYPTLFSKLGLSGEEALGLVSQGMRAGARNSDLAADALKEFQIRATDASEASAEGFAAIGLNAEEMTAKIAAGGDGAREGLAQVLDGLREMEDPVARNAAAVKLFGTQAEDLGDSLFAMDLSTAVDQLGSVTGAAQKMFDTLKDNDATKMEQAQRNIEVAADGIKGALASAFADPLGEAADWVSQNRGPVLDFFRDLVNGAIDFGVQMVEGTADTTLAFGEFVSGPLASAVEGLRGLIKLINPLQDMSEIDGLIEDMRGFDEQTEIAAESIRSLTGGLETARDKANELLDPAVAMGYLNDASLSLASSIDEIGYSADGARIALDDIDLSHLAASESGALLESQIRAATSALNDELAAAIQAGEGQDDLAARYNAGTDALVAQLTQMGLTEDQAWELINSYNQIPGEKRTTLSDNAVERKVEIDGLRVKIKTLPDGHVEIHADTTPASNALNIWMREAPKVLTVEAQMKWVGQNSNPMLRNHDGGVLEFMADGGLRGLSPMQPIAQMVPANTWRVVGDRGDVPEAYVPLDGSTRSWAILLEALSRMPGSMRPMADGGILGAPATPSRPSTPVNISIQVTTNDPHPDLFARRLGQSLEEVLNA
ncbi:phage tail tape measure protein [Leucobacter allii]|uniref:Phage tail tape measure protein n=1 Tax=Leucobacter allii TaxID=2932247 RepID=A0ABY4FQJ9_9MICO|nr:phage tail tape measure protein [Leucobacter allii]UOQ58552.1 phage tail tape measure protein [Leucobacter allii]